MSISPAPRSHRTDEVPLGHETEEPPAGLLLLGLRAHRTTRWSTSRGYRSQVSFHCYFWRSNRGVAACSTQISKGSSICWLKCCNVNDINLNYLSLFRIFCEITAVPFVNVIWICEFLSLQLNEILTPKRFSMTF